MKVKLISILVILFVFAFGCIQTPICGNGICESGETGICPTDCPVELTVNEHIANALLAVRSGGMTTTQSFDLNPSQTIKSSQFGEYGFDAHSIIFAVERKLFETDTFNVENDDDLSYVSYYGQSSKKTKAIVLCELTGESLEETIQISSDEIQEAENVGNAIGLCGYEDYQPCCLVIIK